jgi:L-cysteine desulfidase
MEKSEREHIIALVRREVVPAVGCTEPIAVALCVAKATETLGCVPEHIDVLLSANILKNAMGVGIPGTDMIGLPIAIALGTLIGRSAYGLEVLKDVSPQAVQRAKDYMGEHHIGIGLKQAIKEKLYIEVTVGSGADTAVAVISGGHTDFVLVAKNGTAIYEKPASADASAADDENWLTMRKVYDFATTAPLEEIEFIRQAQVLNERAASESLKGNYGHKLGKTLTRPMGKGIFGDTIFAHIISSTACACDARMAGAPIPVMSNSGSGNQGICATLPVSRFAEENHNTDEELVRALMLSHLTAIYIKQSLGRLSALCGCVVASTGSACGITYLMGGDYQQVTYAVKNMIANLTGMICDGAKPSCALKLASGVSTAVLSAMLAVQRNCVSPVEGIIDDDVDRSIHNLTTIGKDAMDETDRCVLDIMTGKS